MKTYFHDWSVKNYNDLIGKKAMEGDFRITLTNEKILFATYTYEYYSGNAYVLFTKGNKVYEVYGSHCSCMGLEDQWSPELIDKKVIKHRIDEDIDNNYAFNDLSPEEKKILKRILNNLLK